MASDGGRRTEELLVEQHRRDLLLDLLVAHAHAAHYVREVYLRVRLDHS